MVMVDMKNAGCILDKCIYSRLRLPGEDIHFEDKKSESANVMETMFNQIYSHIEPFWQR